MSVFKLNWFSSSIFASLLYLFAAAELQAAVTVIGSQDFESGAIPSTSSWGFGAQEGGKIAISTDKSLNLNGSNGSLKGSYPTPGGGGLFVWGGFDIASLNTNDIYIDFWAKMPNAKHGVKFLKIFGQSVGSNYANTTIGLDYTGVSYGGMYCVSFGDGTGVGNDTANVINFNGEYPSWIGRSYGKATVSLPQKKIWAGSSWGTGWHHFKIHVKFNSGTTKETEVADGAYYVEIDDMVYVDAKGLFNRHYSNKPIQKISFFDWSQGGSSPFEIWYDDIKITTGGFDDRKPAPPIQPTLIVK